MRPVNKVTWSWTTSLKYTKVSYKDFHIKLVFPQRIPYQRFLYQMQVFYKQLIIKLAFLLRFLSHIKFYLQMLPYQAHVFIRRFCVQIFLKFLLYIKHTCISSNYKIGNYQNISIWSCSLYQVFFYINVVFIYIFRYMYLNKLVIIHSSVSGKMLMMWLRKLQILK